MNLNELKEELSRGQRLYEAFEDGVSTVAALEGIEQKAKELNETVNSLTDDRDNLVKLNKDAQDSLLSAQQKAQDIVDTAEQTAKQIIQDGNDQVVQAKASAQFNLDSLLSQAEAIKSKIVSLDAEVSSKTDASNALDAAIAEHRAALEKLLKG